jgi:hypothetical protein
MEDVLTTILHWITSLSALISIIVIAVVPLSLYLIRQYKLPRLVFDDVWKQNDEVTLMGMMYVLKVKQVKGNDKPES